MPGDNGKVGILPAVHVDVLRVVPASAWGQRVRMAADVLVTVSLVLTGSSVCFSGAASQLEGEQLGYLQIPEDCVFRTYVLGLGLAYAEWDLLVY